MSYRKEQVQQAFNELHETTELARADLKLAGDAYFAAAQNAKPRDVEPEQGVSGNGICPNGDPRAAQCPVIRETCGACGGDGGWDGERAMCGACGGMGWVRPDGKQEEDH
jgi:hypothetical protein